MILDNDLGQVHAILKVVEQVKIYHIGKIKMVFVEVVNKIVLYVKRWKIKINPYVRNVKLHLY